MFFTQYKHDRQKAIKAFLSGCDVRAYDHTLETFPETEHSNLRMKHIGVSIANAGPLRTLDRIMAANGHRSLEIQYLKVSKGYGTKMKYPDEKQVAKWVPILKGKPSF